MALQIILFLAVFAVMPLWKKLKINFGFSLMISAVIISFIFGIAPQKTVQNFLCVFTTYAQIKNVVIVTLIGSFGLLLKKYDFLTKVNDALQNMLSGQKTVMMVLPAVVGLLSVPGGAQLSAPFVDELGENLGVKKDIRCVLNLTCRHIATFLVPTSNSLIVLIAAAPQVDMYFLILLNLGFVVLMQLFSYLFYARDIREVRVPVDRAMLPHYIKQLFIYLSPIYMIIVFNGLLKIELITSVLLGFVIIFLISGRGDAKGYFETFKNGLKAKTFIMMVGLFFIQNTIKSADTLINGFSHIFVNSQGIVLALAIYAFALLIAVTTGLSYPAIGVIMPMIASLGLGTTQLTVYAFFVFCCTFIGYFFSPLHLCQLLTMQAMGCQPKNVYREYAKLIPAVSVCAFVLFFAYQWILL
ncbi:MAG: DUF401 family protein [Oscillospiraceae bacterium]|nr:DUF401 family protein [Oscillospiraceae bacterium]